MSSLTGRSYGFYNGKIRCLRVKLKPGTQPVKDVAEGDLIYNSATNKLNFYNGTGWEAVTSST